MKSFIKINTSLVSVEVEKKNNYSFGLHITVYLSNFLNVIGNLEDNNSSKA